MVAKPSPELFAHFALDRGGFSLNAHLQVPADGVTALFGPSGSGKTTFLRMVAGLERPAAGQFYLGDEAWLDVEQAIDLPPHRRPVGYVFQDARLFPHRTVEQNLRYGLDRLGSKGGSVSFDRVVELLRLGPLLDRSPARLSGGEKQRVGLGRGLLRAPRLLLMDEPLASLDEASKGEIIPFIRLVREELSIPMLYVTHSLPEVARLADRIALIDRGAIQNVGPTEEVLVDLTRSLATGDDAGAAFDGTVAAHHRADGLTELAFDAGRLLIPRIDRAVGERVRIRIVASDVSLALDHP
ncbi:MAG: molybdenum ABC transporter ATP-binding protein [Nitrospinae bacterium]|nr:molybdenum ABC transporter ATP-binding protein [Nitrospinota bacterium]